MSSVSLYRLSRMPDRRGGGSALSKQAGMWSFILFVNGGGGIICNGRGGDWSSLWTPIPKQDRSRSGVVRGNPISIPHDNKWRRLFSETLTLTVTKAPRGPRRCGLPISKWPQTTFGATTPAVLRSGPIDSSDRQAVHKATRLRHQEPAVREGACTQTNRGWASEGTTSLGLGKWDCRASSALRPVTPAPRPPMVPI